MSAAAVVAGYCTKLSRNTTICRLVQLSSTFERTVMRIEEPQSKCTIYCLLIICRSRSDVPQVPQVKEQGHLLPITVTLSFPDRSDHVSDDQGNFVCGIDDRLCEYNCDNGDNHDV